jgi:hypothetical protein
MPERDIGGTTDIRVVSRGVLRVYTAGHHSGEYVVPVSPSNFSPLPSRSQPSFYLGDVTRKIVRTRLF